MGDAAAEVRYFGLVSERHRKHHADTAAKLKALMDGHCAEPRRVAEVGVCLPDMCETRPFIEAGVKVDLFEPQPEAAQLLRGAWGGRDNVRVFEVALVDQPGTVVMHRSKNRAEGGCTLDGVTPPIVCRGKTIRVRGERFQVFDPGDYDLVTIDTEGADWFALKWMLSRPKMISVEMTGAKGTWRNPYWGKIKSWMRRNGYSKVAKIMAHDWIYYRHGDAH